MRLIIDGQGVQSLSRNRGIGRYCRSLVQAMAAEPYGHVIVLVLNAGFVETLHECREAMAGVLAPDAIRLWQGPGRQAAGEPADDGRRRAAEHVRASLLQSLDADLLLVGSLFEGLADDAVTGVPLGVVLPPTVAICYDLIPLMRPESYLPSARARRWYYHRLLQMRRAAGVMAISDSARREASEQLGLSQELVRNIQAGVAPQFRPARPGDEAPEALLARYGLPAGMILCVGALEARKNLDGLIRAYALLPEPLRRAHPLVATGWNDAGQVQALRGLALELGLDRQALRLLTDFVPEQDLPGLYRAAALAVCPSLHEGFGLSAAEAMACGVAVLGSNTTSLPEVIGTPSALFDPTDPADIARRLEAVLRDEAARAALAAAGLERSRRFTWPETGRRAWRALETIEAQVRANRQPRVRPGARRLRLAVVMPLASGHALAGEVLYGLAASYRIDILSEDEPAAEPWLAADAGLADIEVGGLDRLATTRFDRVLYCPGDEPRAALRTLQLLDAHPGVVLLGERALNALLGEVLGGSGEAVRQDVLVELHGWQAALAVHAAASALVRYPGDEALARRAVGVLAVGETRPHEAGLTRLRRLDALAAEPCRVAIEDAYAGGEVAGYEACLAALSEAGLAASELAPAAAAASATYRLRPQRRALLLDVSGVAALDVDPIVGGAAGEMLRALCRLAGEIRVEPVRLAEGLELGGAGDALAVALAGSEPMGALLLAHRYAARTLGLPAPNGADRLVEVAAGDVLVELAPGAPNAARLERTLGALHAAGASGFVLLKDLATPTPELAAWLEVVIDQADGALCASHDVERQLGILLRSARPRRRARALRIALLPSDHTASACQLVEIVKATGFAR